MVLQLIVQFVVETKAPGACPKLTLIIGYTIEVRTSTVYTHDFNSTIWLVNAVIWLVKHSHVPKQINDSSPPVQTSIRYTIKIVSVLKSDVTYNWSLMVLSGFTASTTTSTYLKKNYVVILCDIRSGIVIINSTMNRFIRDLAKWYSIVYCRKKVWK